jgi:hypothetical protein
MRLELEALRHYHDHFLSDTCNAFDATRIAEGARLRLPPGRIGSWVALQGRGHQEQNPSAFANGTTEQVLTANPSATQPTLDGEIVDIDFAAIAALPGTFGMSGDLQSLSADSLKRLARWVAFYKEWRTFIAAAHAHHLTPVRPISDRTGWSAVQLCRESDSRSLVVVYRLHDSRNSMRLRLHQLGLSTVYRITDKSSGTVITATGAVLSESGLEARVDRAAGATVYEVEPLA